MAERHRQPSSVAVELSQLAGTLESMQHEIERGVKQIDDSWDVGFARHVCKRLANTEGLLAEIRIGIASAPFQEDDDGA